MLTRQQIKWLTSAMGKNSAFPRIESICVMDSKKCGHIAFCTNQFVINCIGVDDSIENGFYQAIKAEGEKEFKLVRRTDDVGIWYDDMDFILAPPYTSHSISYVEDCIYHFSEMNENQHLTVFSDGNTVKTQLWKKAIGPYKDYTIKVFDNSMRFVKVEIAANQFSIISSFILWYE